MAEFAASFHRHYPDFEVEGLRDLQSFFSRDFFGSGTRVGDTFLGALTIRIFIGGQEHLEHLRPAEVEGYLNHLRDANMSSDFQLHLHLWARHEIYKFGCICPVGSGCLVRAENEVVADGLGKILEQLRALRVKFEKDTNMKAKRRSIRITARIAREEQKLGLSFEIPNALAGCTDREEWMTYIRSELYVLIRRLRHLHG
jgi:hypothetical protein